MPAKPPISILFFVLILGTLTTCGDRTTIDSKTNWTVYYTPRHAKGFQLLINADSSQLRVLLFDAQKEDTIKDWIIPTNGPKRTVCLSTTHLPMFQSVGALNQVVGVGFAHLVKNPEATAAIKNGHIIDISHGNDVSKEIMLSLKPDQFLIYSYGDKDYSTYQQQGIEVIPIAEYLEKTPLGRSEWVVLIGALAGNVQNGITQFAELERTYFEAKNTVNNTNRPTVFTGYYNSGNWYAPPSNSFVAEFLRDAGAHYILQDSLSDQNLVIPFEKMFVAMHACEYWGKLSFAQEDPTDANFISDAPQLSLLPSYQTKKLFYCNTQGTDYFGDAVMQPHVILKDLIEIFHPGTDSMHVPRYFKALIESPNHTSANQ
jgi:iron complex transport system substrate-binding protein